MGVIDSLVSFECEIDDLLAEQRAGGVGRSAVTITVGEGGGTLLSIGRQHSPGVALAHTDELRCFGNPVLPPRTMFMMPILVCSLVVNVSLFID